MLRFLNDPTTTHDVLDVDVGLDRRAADALIAHRYGSDGVLGTPDDDTFDTVGEVIDVHWVGEVGLASLLGYCRTHGWVPEGADQLGIYEGIPFTVEEAEMTLSLVNTATGFQLDQEIGLDSRAVEQIVATRPYYSLPQLADTPWVGGAALTSLRDYVVRYLQNQQDDGSFVLTPDLATYYLDVMTTVLQDDREFFEELLSVSANADEADRILSWMEIELENEINGRIGQVFPSEQELLDELFAVLERLQSRGAELLLN